MMADYFLDDEAQELFAKIRVQLRLCRQLAQPGDLAFLARGVRWGQGMCGLIGAHRLGDAKPFGQHMDQRGIDIVDAGAIGGQSGIGSGDV